MEILDHSGSETGRTSLPRLVGSPRLFPDAAFLVVVVAQLLLIWAFPRIPTQDGPVHVASAIAFRDLGEPGTSYATLFERRLDMYLRVLLDDLARRAGGRTHRSTRRATALGVSSAKRACPLRTCRPMASASGSSRAVD